MDEPFYNISDFDEFARSFVKTSKNPILLNLLCNFVSRYKSSIWSQIYAIDKCYLKMNKHTHTHFEKASFS